MAALLRERADAATDGPYSVTAKSARWGAVVAVDGRCHPAERDGYGGRVIGESIREGDREHIMGWTPEMAHSVADLLDLVALMRRSLDRVGKASQQTAPASRTFLAIEEWADRVAVAYMRSASGGSSLPRRDTTGEQSHASTPLGAADVNGTSTADDSAGRGR